MKLKRFIWVFAFLCLALALVLPGKAEAATEGIYTYQVTNGAATITDCNTSVSGDLTIPATLGGYPVTGIGSSSFSDCSSLTSVIIPNGVKTIDMFAFARCSSLASITIPDSVTSIGSWAFTKCTSLSGIWVSKNNTTYCSDAKGVLFDKAMTKVVTVPKALHGVYTIPDGVTDIGDYAFDECSGLTSVTIPDGVTSIGKYAFQDCTSLTSVAIPASVTSIRTDFCVFSDCTNLSGIWVNENNTVYSSDARGVLYDKALTTVLLAPQGLSGAYAIADGVTDIGDDAFKECSSLTSVTIPDSVTRIGERAFYYCAGLTSIEIPDSVTTIAPLAFSDCDGLTSVTISADVGEHAFQNCSSLKSVTVLGKETVIGHYAFQGCRSLTSVTIQPGVITVGSEAFGGCTSLTSITIPDSVTSIGVSAFAWCTSLTSVTIPDSVTKINDGVFSGCTSLTSITIPDSVVDVGMYAFDNCTLLKVIYCGTKEQWKNISVNAYNDPWPTLPQFHNYENNTCTICGDVYKIPQEGVFTYEVTDGKATITNCDASVSGELTIPSTLGGYPVTAIGNNVFYFDKDLTSVTIEEGITAIGHFAFNNCTNLTRIKLPKTLSKIGAYAFTTCINLQTIELDGETAGYMLDDRGVLYNKNQTVLVKAPTTLSGSYIIPDSVTQIEEGALAGCSELETLQMPSAGKWRVYEPFAPGDYKDFPVGGLFGEKKYDGSVAINQPVYCQSTDGDRIILKPVWTFYFPAKLKTIVVTTKINDDAFYGCTNLETIGIGSDVTKIGPNAFSGCSQLQKVIYCGTQAQWNAISIKSGNTALTNAELQRHSFVNGACSLCGEEDLTAKVKGVVRARSLSLDGVVVIRNTVAFMNEEGTANTTDLSDAYILKNGKVLYWSMDDMPADPAQAVLGTQTSESGLTDAGSYEGVREFYSYSYGLPAKQYNDTVYCRTYIEVNGKPCYGEISEYSVVTYCRNTFNKDTAAAERLKPLLTTMLNYGASAQLFFGYRTDALANSCLERLVDNGRLPASCLAMTWDEGLLTAPVAPDTKLTGGFAWNNVERTARTVGLEGAVRARMTFAWNLQNDRGTQLPAGTQTSVYYWSEADYRRLAASDTALSRENASYVRTGTEVKEIYTAEYGYEYEVQSEMIPAKRLGESQYAVAVFTAPDGTQYCSGVQVYSPEVYAATMLEKFTTTDALRNLVKWMVLYGEAAKQYFV